MIVVDTNVVSELIRGCQAAASFPHWASGLGELPVTTVITRAEIIARSRRLGRLIAAMNALIAAIWDAGAILAARDQNGFAAAGITTMEPGTDRSPIWADEPRQDWIRE